MDEDVIKIFVVCDDLLKGIGILDDPQAQMSNAEVMSFAIISARLMNGNHQRTRWLCLHLRYFRKVLSPSRINRRLHQLPIQLWAILFRCLAQIFRKRTTSLEFCVDSFPVHSCAKSRIDRHKIFVGKEYIGYAASKKRYFCGLKVHMIVTSQGDPVELYIRPASENDLSVLWKMSLELPKGSTLYADGAYNSYELEDILREDEGLLLLPKRRSRTARRHTPELERTISSKRQRIETTFSQITGMLPATIRARTQKGFLIRLIGTILAHCICTL